MITKVIDENSVSCIPEESDDLMILRRIIKKGDFIVGNTTRVIKPEKDFSRPDRGERVNVKIELEIEKISLDDVFDRLRLGGTITKSDNESVPHGSHHSFLIKIDEGFNLIKKKWSSIEKKLLQTKNQNFGFLLIALDTTVCGIGRIRGTHLHLIPNIYSGSSGKRYKTKFNIENFFEKIHLAVVSAIKDKDTVIIFGPGETKKRFGNYLQKLPIGQKYKINVIEGIDSEGEDGIHIFTKSKSMKEIMSESKLAKVFSIIDEIMIQANKKGKKFTMGFEETEKAKQYSAIESLVFSEKIIQTQDEQKVIDFLNEVEKSGAKTFSVDSTTDVGLRVTGMGGIVSLLRFSVT